MRPEEPLDGRPSQGLHPNYRLPCTGDRRRNYTTQGNSSGIWSINQCYHPRVQGRTHEAIRAYVHTLKQCAEVQFPCTRYCTLAKSKRGNHPSPLPSAFPCKCALPQQTVWDLHICKEI